MNLIIQIQGREAIPVRAIPLLTNWRFFTPDVVAQVLWGDKELDGFVVGALQAFHLQNGAVNALPKIWWKNFATPELRARSESIKSVQPSHELGYQQWRDESLPLLPAGAFVWKDEFEVLHAQNWDKKLRAFDFVCSGDSEEEQNSPLNPRLVAFIENGLTGLEEWRELDFSPYVRPALWSVVMEGLPLHQATPLLTAKAPVEMSDCANAKRKAKLGEVLNKIRAASIVDVQDHAEVEAVLNRREEAKSMLAASEKVLRKAVPFGSIKNLGDAEVAVSARQQAMDKIVERNRVRRGDYTESYQAPLATTPSAVPVAPEIDYAMLATRQQLIEAFGTFTGLNMSWFNNLKDKPALRKARLVPGMSGRRSTEPLFCPFQALQWLVDPRRKAGRPLSEDAAWRILQFHFPKVYNVYSIVDPRND